MAYVVEPTCRYGHGELVLQIAKLGPKRRDSSRFISPCFSISPIGIPAVLEDFGFIFEIWKCPQCSYIEIHDTDPDDVS